nr:hypothetical protein [Tanacetum cinerariifolium]
MSLEEFEELIAQGVADALANYKATYAANALEAESQSQNSNDGDNGNGGNGNGGDGNGNHGDRGNNKNGNPNDNGRGAMLVARRCTYQDFVKCQPLNFKGTEGVVDLTRWLRRWKQCSTSEIPLDLMKVMTEVYCSRNEIQKMETKSWNLTVKNNDLAAYTQRFQELALLCTRIVPGEEDRLERAYTAGGNEGRVYVGPHPLCNKFKLHHIGPCTIKCRSCGKIGHLTRDCKPTVPVVVNQRAPVVNQRSTTCFE